LHVGALSLASLSIVQAVISAGLVFRAILAERSFGFQLGRRQWTGLLITAVGPALLALTTHDHASSGRADRRPEHCDRDQRRADRFCPMFCVWSGVTDRPWWAREDTHEYEHRGWSIVEDGLCEPEA
jgi:hypothetical protein